MDQLFTDWFTIIGVFAVTCATTLIALFVGLVLTVRVTTRRLGQKVLRVAVLFAVLEFALLLWSAVRG